MKAYFSGGPLDCQYRDMERTPIEWHVPIPPPVPCCTFEAYIADPIAANTTLPIKRAVYKRAAQVPESLVIYWLDHTQ